VTVGEAAGFQDTLWGFGLRYALTTGHMAARAFLAGSPRSYDLMWRRRFAGHMRSASVNRFLFGVAGDRTLSWVLGRAAAKGDPRTWLRRLYAPTAWKAALYPVIGRSVQSRRRHKECLMAECDCTWCRCQRHGQRPKGA